MANVLTEFKVPAGHQIRSGSVHMSSSTTPQKQLLMRALRTWLLEGVLGGPADGQHESILSSGQSLLSDPEACARGALFMLDEWCILHGVPLPEFRAQLSRLLAADFCKGVADTVLVWEDDDGQTPPATPLPPDFPDTSVSPSCSPSCETFGSTRVTAGMGCCTKSSGDGKRSPWEGNKVEFQFPGQRPLTPLVDSTTFSKRPGSRGGEEDVSDCLPTFVAGRPLPRLRDRASLSKRRRLGDDSFCSRAPRGSVTRTVGAETAPEHTIYSWCPVTSHTRILPRAFGQFYEPSRLVLMDHGEFGLLTKLMVLNGYAFGHPDHPGQVWSVGSSLLPLQGPSGGTWTRNIGGRHEVWLTVPGLEQYLLDLQPYRVKYSRIPCLCTNLRALLTGRPIVS